VTTGGRNEELRATLAHLHEQLQGAEALDPDVRADLHAAMGEIEDALEAESGRNLHEPSLRDRLSDLTRHFEESHPNLAAAVGRVVDTLANLGI
jgi:hypothetical protein